MSSSAVTILCTLLLLLSMAISSSTGIGSSNEVSECAHRRDSRLKGLASCCLLVGYCRCLKGLCHAGDNQCQGELNVTCGDSYRTKCDKFHGPKLYPAHCNGYDWDVLVPDHWTGPTEPEPASDKGGGDGGGGGRGGSAGKLTPVIIAGLVVLMLLVIVGLAAYCWCLGPKKKKGSKETQQQQQQQQQRSTGRSKARDTSKKTKKTKGAAATAAKRSAANGGSGSEGESAANFGKSRSKGRSHSGAPARGGTNSDTEKNLSTKQKSKKGAVGAASKAHQGGSSFNSRQVHTVDLKTTGGGKGRGAMRYTKFRNALKPTKTS